MKKGKKEINKETLSRVKNLRIIDDAFFRVIASHKLVCQEMLRTLLDDEMLIVKKVTPQKSESSLEREVILDALCELGDGTLCNIEMQKSNSNDDIKRVRFHASILTVNHTPKSTKFSDIPNIKILYITEYDALGNGQAVTHISRCQMTDDVYRPINDGEDIVFANARSDEENKYTHLLKLFLQKESFDDKMYPELSKTIKYYKDSEEGREIMCEIVEEYAKEIYADELAKKDAELAEKLAEKDAELAKRDAKLAEKDAEIKAVTAEKDAEIAELRKLLNEKN